MNTSEVYQSLVASIASKKHKGAPLVVGINGIDGSGKTTLSKKLGALLKGRGYSVCCISIDNFHYPREHRYRRGENSPEAYYHDSFNCQAFIQGALRPVKEAQAYPVKCQVKSHDLAEDRAEAVFQDIDENTIVLLEGVFIFRPDIIPFLGLKVFVDASFDTILKRVQKRDREIIGSEEKVLKRYRQKYIPGQKLYFKDADPLSVADIVIDNNDFSAPKITRSI
ncbi:MAG: uridine kinase [Alphaproteobacteria bacterium]|nr:uridine kinase [Alphaproteobacteria bacterium]